MFMCLHVYWPLNLCQLGYPINAHCLYVCLSPNLVTTIPPKPLDGLKLSRDNFLQVSSCASDKNLQRQGRLRQHTLLLVLFSYNSILANQFVMKNGFRQIAIVQHEKFQTKIQFFILQKDTQIFYHQILNMNGCYSK